MTTQGSQNSKHIRIRCDCGKTYRVPIDSAGKKAKCACGRVFTIPTRSPSPKTTPESEEAGNLGRLSGQKPQIEPLSTKKIIRYKCWTCANEMESPATKIGQRETCSKCGTPNLVPRPSKVESGARPGLCYFCRQRTGNARLASIVMIRKFLTKPPYVCRKCGTEWEETYKVESSDQEGTYKARCPSCHSEDVVPTQLPAVPLEKEYTRFRFTGGELCGYVCVPRCHKCKRNHSAVRSISWALALIVSFVALSGLFFLPSQPGDRIGWQGFAAVFVCAFLILGLPILFLSRLVLRRIIARRTIPEGTAKSHPAVQELQRHGWTFIQMAPNANFIRSSLSSGENQSQTQEQHVYDYEFKGVSLQAALDEVANLPRRNDWTTKAKLLGFNAGIAVVSLLGIPLGFLVAQMEPSKALLPISLFGFVLIIAGPIACIYFLGKGVYFFSRSFDAKNLLEHFIPNGLNYRLDKKHVQKMKRKAPLQLILPSDRRIYSQFYDFSRQICEREVQRRGGDFIDCKSWHIASSQKGHHVTCVVKLVRTTLSEPNAENPLGELTLEAVKSNAGNWYLVLPDPEKVKSWLKFTATDTTDSTN